ncbi:MAG: hypothetical protein ACD_15C00047G0006 [uncultured bacterium]|nr:MAG: hypothetical protein ACD_15C00047G0006 [uncultured bacterium]
MCNCEDGKTCCGDGSCFPDEKCAGKKTSDQDALVQSGATFEERKGKGSSGIGTLPFTTKAGKAKKRVKL